MMLNTNQKTNPPPKFIKKYNTSDEAMLNVRNEIQSEEEEEEEEELYLTPNRQMYNASHIII